MSSPIKNIVSCDPLQNTLQRAPTNNTAQKPIPSDDTTRNDYTIPSITRSCICGDQLKQRIEQLNHTTTDTHSFTANCDQCYEEYKNDDIVFYCAVSTPMHPGGYDICKDCAISDRWLLSIEDIKALRELHLFNYHNADTPMKDATQNPMTFALDAIDSLTITTPTPMSQGPFQRIDQGLAVYYHRHGSVHYNRIFIHCMRHNGFCEDDIHTELSENCKPNECAYVWALNDFISPRSFPIPSYLHIPDENKDVFMFYVLQWIYAHNTCPSSANMKDSMMSLAAGELVHDEILEDTSLSIDPPRDYSKDAVAPQQVKSVKENDEEKKQNETHFTATIESGKLLRSLKARTPAIAYYLDGNHCSSSIPIQYSCNGPRESSYYPYSLLSVPSESCSYYRKSYT
eukprot:18832_1